LSILGVARELKAVLPIRGFKCEWVQKEKTDIEKINAVDKIEVIIEDKTLVPRFSAIVMDNVKFGESPKLIKGKVRKSGYKAIR